MNSSIIHNSQKAKSFQSCPTLCDPIDGSPPGSTMWMQTKCLLMEEYINKKWHIHTTEYHSVLKRKDTLIYATTWMNLEEIMTNEISPIHKTTNTIWFHFYEGPRVVKFINRVSKRCFPGPGKKGKWGVLV